ncbi:MAG: flippase-like domain-containing protein [Barnesiella sp.]|nr:flippase-like domain-containing protein [Barnesiella sp.]
MASSSSSGIKGIISKFVKYGLPTLLSVGLCYVLFRDIDLKEMYRFIVSECDFSYVAIAMVLGALSFWIRGMRWRIQLRAMGVTPPASVMTYSIAGTYAVNLVLPRLGELWRCEYVARRERTSFASVLGSMVSERLADTVTVLLMLLATIIWAGSAVDSFVDAYPETVNGIKRIVTSPVVYAAGIVAVAAVWLFLRLNRRRSWVIKLKKQLQELLSGITSIFHMRRAWLWLILTVLLWGTYLTQMILCFEAFAPTSGYMGAHGPLIAIVAFVLGSISMGIPSNGGVGPYQIAIAFGIHCFMADTLTREQSLSFATLVLGAQIFVTIVCGLVSFVAIAIDNRRQSRLAAQETE